MQKSVIADREQKITASVLGHHDNTNNTGWHSRELGGSVSTGKRRGEFDFVQLRPSLQLVLVTVLGGPESLRMLVGASRPGSLRVAEKME